MSKNKKYLLLAAGILLAISGIITGYFAVVGLTNAVAMQNLANKWAPKFGGGVAPAQMLSYLQYGVAFLTSSSIIALAFAAFAIRYSFYSSKEYFIKRSILYAMAYISVIIVNPIAGALFLVAVYAKDENFVFEEEDLSLDVLADKLEKLENLKTRGLITEEEYANSRKSLLEDN